MEENNENIDEEKKDFIQDTEVNKEQENLKEEETDINKEEIKEEIKDAENISADGFKRIEYKAPKKKSYKKLIIFMILLIVLILISTIFAILNIDNDNVINGIYIENVKLSNLSNQEATKIVRDKMDSISDIELKLEDYETIVKLEELGITIDVEDALNRAINYAKTNNIILDNYAILKANLFKEKFKLNISIDEEKYNDMVKKIQNEVPGAVKEYTYEIVDEELIITSGTKGIEINTLDLKKEIIEQIKSQFNGETKEIELPVKEKNPDPIDIEKIYNEIYTEAKDAYIIEEPFELHKEEKGIDFNITIDEAKELLKEEKESYIIPLKISEAKVKVKDLGEKLFKQNLSKFTTIYDAGNTNRASNIALAAKTINGTILLPGEVFSYNGTIGNTTREKGYKLGGAYVGGKVVQAYGGGICQVSTTLYNAVLYANLEIVERHNHSYSVAYVPAGRDATVSYGGKDFKFKNTRTYPIRIDANAKNGIISVSITGIKEEKEYDVELTSTVLSTTECKTVYENNSSLAEGKEKVIQAGHKGQTSVVYKIVKYNNKVISKTLLSKDTYKPMDRIVQKGTKKSSKNNKAKETIKEEPDQSQTQEKQTQELQNQIIQ